MTQQSPRHLNSDTLPKMSVAVGMLVAVVVRVVFVAVIGLVGFTDRRQMPGSLDSCWSIQLKLVGMIIWIDMTEERDRENE